MDIFFNNNFDNIETNQKAYGGRAGIKLGVIFNNHDYIMKFPASLKDKNIKDSNLSYNTSPLSEYIGSHIYSMLGVDTHDTILGTSKNRIVVLCKDFTMNNVHLIEFEKWLNTDIRKITLSNNTKLHQQIDFDYILDSIYSRTEFNFIKMDMITRFWDMFIIDSIIENGDRNNGNWGFLEKDGKILSLAPVYDNGNSFRTTWDDNKTKINLSPQKIDEIIMTRNCIYNRNNHRIMPLKFIKEMEFYDCNKSIIKITEIFKDKLNTIFHFIENLPNKINGVNCCSDIKKLWIITSLSYIIEKVLVPTYLNIKNIKNLSSQEQRSNKMSELKYTKNQDIVFHGTDNPLIIPEGTVLPLGVTPTHCYVFKDGTICKSVTQVLENQEFADNFSQLSGNAKIIADEAAQFGTFVHNTVEKYLKSCEQGHYTFNKDKDYQKLQDIIKELIPELYNEYRIRHTPKGSLEKIADKTGKEMTWGESISDHATFILQKIDSLNLKYAYPEQILALRQPMPVAGTSDLIGVKEDGRVIIVDYKTGNKSPIKEEMQVNFYAKMLEINTYQDDKEAGTIADELITINSREKEVYKYQKKNTSLIADILLAEKEDKKLSEVITCPTKGLEQLYDNKLSEACDKRRDIMLMRANFLSEHPDFEEQYNIYINLLKEEDKVGKDVIKEAITELGLPKITREDFSATLSNRTTKTVDFNLLLEKYPQAYAECVSEIKTPVLNITTNKEFFKEQVKRKIEQKNNNIRML